MFNISTTNLLCEYSDPNSFSLLDDVSGLIMLARDTRVTTPSL